ncbi:hypothetical protein ACFXB3_12750 [Streptomyces sp. NPDC059447]|uniref:hypothetical protein n=1 Tax=Streptomyces sp. NPDC059447 TaxID=3346834 RepID=UPI0036A940E2
MNQIPEQPQYAPFQEPAKKSLGMKKRVVIGAAAIAGVVVVLAVAGVGADETEPPKPRSARDAYESGWTALRDGKAKEGSETSCSALVDPRESKQLQDAFRQGCTDRVLLRGNKVDEFPDTVVRDKSLPKPVVLGVVEDCSKLRQYTDGMRRIAIISFDNTSNETVKFEMRVEGEVVRGAAGESTKTLKPREKVQISYPMMPSKYGYGPGERALAACWALKAEGAVIE